MSPTLEELIAKVPLLLPMTRRQREEQRFSWSYGNLACTTNHKPTRAAFAKMAQNRGWTPDEFETWALGLEWW